MCQNEIMAEFVRYREPSSGVMLTVRQARIVLRVEKEKEKILSFVVFQLAVEPVFEIYTTGL